MKHLRLTATSLLLLLACGGAAAPDGVSLAPSDAFFGEVARAHTLTVTVFKMDAGSAMARAIETACDRGARVSVILASSDFAYVQRANTAVKAELERHRCGVRYSARPLHMKLALLDRVLYLSDKNFDPTGLLLRDTRPEDRDVVAATLRGEPASNDHFWTRKGDALSAEGQFIDTAQHTLFVETESFGAKNPVFDAIIRREQARVPTYLLVAKTEYDGDPREQALVGQLRCFGINVRLSNQNAKLAVPDDGGAWVGSSNATAGLPDQVDFGMLISGPQAARVIAARFSRDWQSSMQPRPFACRR